MKNEVLKEFRRIAESCDAQLLVADTFCEFSKNGITLRTRWSVERIEGVFTTLSASGTREFGLPYLVKFRNGTSAEFAASISDNPKATAEVAKKYALPFLIGQMCDFYEFLEFAKEEAEKGLRKGSVP